MNLIEQINRDSLAKNKNQSIKKMAMNANLKRVGSIILIFMVMTSMSAWSSGKFGVQKKDVHIFILMGQSNMAGYGELLPQDTVPLNKVWMLRGWTNKGAEFTWHQAKHPIHNRLGSDQFGLAGAFAKKYLEKHPEVEVAFIPVAYGGAEISSLNKGTDVYADALNKAIWAKEQGIVKGILWHQGESDTVTPEKSKDYSERMKQLILDVRSDLKIDNLPFVLGNLAEFYGTGPDHDAPERVKSINRVKSSLRNMPNLLPNVAFVESKGLKARQHHMVHFNRESLIIFGQRYANAFFKLQSN
ncbi:sialate O-acetylesterase [Sunxiuqinia sp. sy24]|uniref:sialate O-acetylesterase n=1 Tax=Sunxiuqinia sp. sy24 TaxID=3461495 RepID=UPI00404526FE